MKEKMGITVLGAVGIAAAVIAAILLIRYLLNPGERGPEQGQADDPRGRQ